MEDERVTFVSNIVIVLATDNIYQSTFSSQTIANTVADSRTTVRNCWNSWKGVSDSWKIVGKLLAMVRKSYISDRVMDE